MVALSLETKRLAESGCAILYATTGLDGSIRAGRGWGISISQDRCWLRLLLCRAQSERCLAHLAENSWIAVSVTGMPALHSMQFKGRVTLVGAMTHEDTEVNRAWVKAFVEDAETVGLPAASFEHGLMTADTALDVRVEQVFIQTPGPNAGQEVV